MPTTTADRIAGTLLGVACGDALGAGYEFTTPPPDEPITMKGGGLRPWAPGEWTDDTQMTVCIAEIAATGRADVEAIGQRFLDWYAAGPKDVGVSTAAVLRGVDDPLALPAAAHRYVTEHPDGGAGNGSLMRTAPLALAHLGDDHRLAAAATAISALTHGDRLADETCVLCASPSTVPSARSGSTASGTDWRCCPVTGRRSGPKSWMPPRRSLRRRSCPTGSS
jgi:ADP-ribosyl-[dinitrogen reductase] hydrolase